MPNFTGKSKIFGLYVYSMKLSAERYLSPESGRRTAIFFPSFSFLVARYVAAANAAPDDIPIKIPSVFAASLA